MFLSVKCFMHHRVLHETKSKTSGGKRKIIRPVWANDLSDKKVKNTKLKKKKKKKSTNTGE